MWSEISDFKSARMAQRFVSVHAVDHNIFDIGQHLALQFPETSKGRLVLLSKYCRPVADSALRRLPRIAARPVAVDHD